ncbi:septum site-determining protein Ssd [Microlunatus speluncae]|uniref:septum site-determining protein Ssd n=1 Tax=Microlunatus speluncae TaxID=2594267 RepID=UPI0012661627|nr:septum site-determining protein Ssd [Microlunatus speluncae]
MRAEPARSPHVVVLATDPDLLDRVLAVAAAAGVEPRVLPDPGAIRPLWAMADLVIVGVEVAPRLATMALPRRDDVFLVAPDEAGGETTGWSGPLGAAVVLLPGGATWLTAAIADAGGGRAGASRLVAFVGGSGGAGASTCAAAFAYQAAQLGRSTLLIDADPRGGGIDLLLGAEGEPGWRWPRLDRAQGHLGQLAGQLPRVEGVDLLSMARVGPPPAELPTEPSAEAVKAVLLAGLRDYQVVVVDLPRPPTDAGAEVLRRADRTYLVVAGDVRGLAAARQTAAELSGLCSDLAAVLRLRPGGQVDATTVRDGVGIEVVAAVRDEPGVLRAADRGEPPGRSARSALAKACRSLLDQLAETDEPPGPRRSTMSAADGRAA